MQIQKVMDSLVTKRTKLLRHEMVSVTLIATDVTCFCDVSITLICVCNNRKDSETKSHVGGSGLCCTDWDRRNRDFLINVNSILQLAHQPTNLLSVAI